MPRSGGVVIQLTTEPAVQYILGKNKIQDSPLPPFNVLTCDFLSELSGAIRKNKSAKQFPDLMTFSFWCRKGNIQGLKKDYLDGKTRVGLGLVFHITPSNVPMNFAFSFAYSLLSGNSNVVRLPSANFQQTDLLCSIIGEVLSQDSFKTLRDRVVFVRYPINNSTTEEFTRLSDGLMLWGGDRTISEIKKLNSKPSARELIFSDRYSISIINADMIVRLGKTELVKLAQDFYNDTYLMDQNACSSPSFVIWSGNKVEEAKNIFWQQVLELTSKSYEIQLVNVVDKLTQVCMDAANDISTNFDTSHKDLFKVELPKVLNQHAELKGACGYFYEYSTSDLNELVPMISEKCQTITYFGEAVENIKNLVLENNLKGVDRITPIGTALEIGPIWDGYDIISSLTRIINIS